MKKKLTSVLLFLAMSVGVVSAQTSKVTGKVVGEDGEPCVHYRTRNDCGNSYGF